MVEILKQDQFRPLSVEEQVLIIYAGINGFLDNLPLSEIKRFEEGLYPFLDSNYQALKEELRARKEIDDAARAQIEKALKEWLDLYSDASSNPEATPQ